MEAPHRAAGTLLREARLARGWSQQQLVDELNGHERAQGRPDLGIDVGYVSEWENGRRGISLRYATRLGRLVNIDPDLLHSDPRAQRRDGRQDTDPTAGPKPPGQPGPARSSRFQEDRLRPALIRIDDLPVGWQPYRHEEARRFQRINHHGFRGQRLDVESSLTVGASFTGWRNTPGSQLLRLATSWGTNGFYNLYTSISVLDGRAAGQLITRLTELCSDWSDWTPSGIPDVLGEFKLIESASPPIGHEAIRIRMRHRFTAAPNGIRDYLFIRHGELIMMVLYTSVVYSPDLALVPELAATAGQRLAAIELG